MVGTCANPVLLLANHARPVRGWAAGEQSAVHFQQVVESYVGAWFGALDGPSHRVNVRENLHGGYVTGKVPQALGLLKRMSKRVRKYSGSLLTVTQNPGDFLAPEVAREGEPVLANASTVPLLRQEGRDLPMVAGLYHLSDAEQERLATARVGEGLIICGNSRAWVTVGTAPHETEIMYGVR